MIRLFDDADGHEIAGNHELNAAWRKANQDYLTALHKHVRGKHGEAAASQAASA
jgi:hypothetical protein